MNLAQHRYTVTLRNPSTGDEYTRTIDADSMSEAMDIVHYEYCEAMNISPRDIEIVDAVLMDEH